jgi:hypothetical protein
MLTCGFWKVNDGGVNVGIKLTLKDLNTPNLEGGQRIFILQSNICFV